MNPARLPASEEAFSDLERLLPLMFGSLEYGVQLARDVFESWNTESDPHLFASIVRHHAKDHLDSACQPMPEYRRNPLLNDGIMVVYGRYNIRFLKSDNGTLPDSNLTISRVEFYRQTSLDLELWKPHRAQCNESPASCVPVNLVLAWDADRHNLSLCVWLLCPRPGPFGTGSFSVAWSEELQHPAEMLRVDLPAVNISADDDLPIRAARQSSAGMSAG